MLSLVLRTCGRYLVPVAVLAAIALAPVLWFALRLPPPADAKAARQLLVVAWLIAGTAWIPQLALVAAVAPAVRAIAAGERVSQLRVLARGLVQGARMLPVVAAVVAAVVVGGIALVVPGALLLVLLALAGASLEPGITGPLVDSAAVVRARPRGVAIAVVALLVADLALAAAGYLALAGPVPTKAAPAQLAAPREVVRVVALGLLVISPLGATALAALRVRARS